MLKKKNFIKVTAIVLLIQLTVSNPLGFAMPPKEIASQETIFSQGITGNDAVAPYMLTGESLVLMLQETVGFDTPGSSVVFNRRTAQLFVKTIPSNHEVVEAILGDLRKAKKRQIEIETRFITVASADFEGLGAEINTVNFVAKDRNINDPGDSIILGSGTVDGSTITNPATTTTFPDLNTIFDSSGIGGAFGIGLQKAGEFDISAFIDALSRKADVNTLASPTLTVFNNQRANISIKKHAFYISEIKTDFTSVLGVETAVQNPEIRIAPSGTILDVTPTINSNGSITLELHPSFLRTDITTTATVQNGTGGTNDSVTLPIYTVQEINTTVTIENGGVIILGGLISEEEINERNKVPLLGSIPILGKFLFQNNQTRNIKSHLLIFVKAKIKNL